MSLKEKSNNAEDENKAKDPPLHPLLNNWVLWYCKNEKKKQWEECLKQVALFNTVEDFWALYNHIQLASGLSFGSDYYLFKEGIQPMWEDKSNEKGGRWLVNIDKLKRNDLLDHYWLELLLAMIGEQFDDGEQICGAVVNIRNKGDKISLWTRDMNDDEANMRIGQVLKQKLGLIEIIYYESHRDCASKTSSSIKPVMKL